MQSVAPPSTPPTSSSSTRRPRRAHCPRICAESITESIFYDRFLRTNRPCIISGLIDGWGSVQRWRHEDGSPNIGELMHGPLRAAAVPVDVDDCVHGCRRTVEMTLEEHAAWWNRQVTARCSARRVH